MNNNNIKSAFQFHVYNYNELGCANSRNNPGKLFNKTGFQKHSVIFSYWIRLLPAAEDRFLSDFVFLAAAHLRKRETGARKSPKTSLLPTRDEWEITKSASCCLLRVTWLTIRTGSFTHAHAHTCVILTHGEYICSPQLNAERDSEAQSFFSPGFNVNKQMGNTKHRQKGNWEREIILLLSPGAYADELERAIHHAHKSSYTDNNNNNKKEEIIDWKSSSLYTACRVLLSRHLYSSPRSVCLFCILFKWRYCLILHVGFSFYSISRFRWD